MNNINFFGIKNYRIFDTTDGLSLPLKPITILSGANNTGKSSILKALLMFKDSIKNHKEFFDLDLSGKEHFLGDFDDVLHDKSTNQIEITLPFSLLGLKYLQLILRFDLKDDKKTYTAPLKSITVKNSRTEIEIMNFEYFEVIDEGFSAEDYDNNTPTVGKIETLINVTEINGYFSDIFKIYGEYSVLYNDVIIEEKRKRYPDGKTSDFMPIQIDNTKLIKGLQSNFLTKKNDYDFFRIINQVSKDLKLDKANDYVTSLDENIYKHSYSIHADDFSPQPNRPTQNDLFLNQILTEIKRSLTSDPNSTNEFQKLFVDHFQKTWSSTIHLYERIAYLPSVRGLTSRVYNLSNQNHLISLIKIYDYNKDVPIFFVNRWIKEFEIGTKLKVNVHQKYDIAQLAIQTEQNEKTISRPLIDFGYGILQFVTILIQIACLAGQTKSKYGNDSHYEQSLLIIEEPETNLHPKWQSRLAEMFTEASNEFNIQFIIETHSEYMIRNFQNLVADKSLEKDNIIIHYLRDKNNPNSKPQMSSINIEADGSIDYDQFDNGFFDEHTKLEQSLLNINFTKDFQKLKGDLNAKIKDFENAEKEVEAKKIVIEQLQSNIDEQINKLSNLETKYNIDYYKEKVETELGDDKDKFHESSIKYYANVEFLKYVYGNDFIDYSTLVVQCGRIIETELFDWFADVILAKRDTSVSYKVKPHHSDPNISLGITNWNVTTYHLGTFKVGVNRDENGSSLKLHGALIKVKNKTTKEQFDLGNNELWDTLALVYLNDELKEDVIGEVNFYKTVYDELENQFSDRSEIFNSSFLEHLKHIIVERNNAAHKIDIIDYDTAKDIYEYTKEFIEKWNCNKK